MKVDDEKAFEFLNMNGILATMRNYHFRVGSIVQVEHKGERKFPAIVIGVLANRKMFRKQFVALSGFESVDEWVSRSIELCRRIPDYIVIIAKIGFDRGDMLLDVNEEVLNKKKK